MTKRRDEVEAAVYSIVNNVSAIEPTLISQESLKLLVAVLNDGLEAVTVVNSVTEARRINDSQSQFDASLFNFNRGSVEFYSLVCLFC